LSSEAGGTEAGALEVVERVAGAAARSEEGGDVVAGQPGPVDVAAGFVMFDGLLACAATAAPDGTATLTLTARSSSEASLIILTAP
jgi:hypothetical protein